MFILDAIHDDVVVVKATEFTDVGYVLLPIETGKQLDWKLYKMTLNGQIMYDSNIPLTFFIDVQIRCNIHKLSQFGIKIGDELAWSVDPNGSLVLTSV